MVAYIACHERVNYLSVGGVKCYDDFLVNMVVGFHELRSERWFQLTHVRGRGYGKCGCCLPLDHKIRCHKGP